MALFTYNMGGGKASAPPPAPAGSNPLARFDGTGTQAVAAAGGGNIREVGLWCHHAGFRVEGLGFRVQS
jgi:hypothetical protein